MLAPQSPPQALLGDGAVAVDLPVQQGGDEAEVHGVGELQDVLDVQNALVGEVVLGGVGDRLLQQDLAVVLLPDDVAVAVGDVDEGGVPPGVSGELDVQQAGGLGADDLDGGVLGVGGDSGVVGGGDAGDDL